MLNEGQQKIHDEAIRVLMKGDQQTYQYSGQAGTGKSYTAYQICVDMHLQPWEILPMAFTGAAASVMRTKGFSNATTLHSGLFKVVEVENPEYKNANNIDLQFGVPSAKRTIRKFVPRPVTDFAGYKLIVVDEGYMTPASFKPLLERTGLPILVTGDRRQLAPVMSAPAYLVEDNIPELTEPMRQGGNSPIIALAHSILRHEPVNTGLYGNGKILIIDNDDVSDEMMKHAGFILACTNSWREELNQHIRKDVYGYRSQLPAFGDRMICRHNNHGLAHEGIELSNGLLGYCVSSPDAGAFTGKNFTMDFLPDIMNTPFKALNCDFEYLQASPKARANYFNPYNTGEEFEYGYCITVHLSQGSEAPCGIYYDEYFGRGLDMQTRLQYTAVTRFKDSLIYVKQRRKFF